MNMILGLLGSLGAPEQSAPAVQIDVAGNDVHPAHAEQSAPKPGQSPPPAMTGIEHCIVQ